MGKIRTIIKAGKKVRRTVKKAKKLGKLKKKPIKDVKYLIKKGRITEAVERRVLRKITGLEERYFKTRAAAKKAMRKAGLKGGKIDGFKGEFRLTFK